MAQFTAKSLRGGFGAFVRTVMTSTQPTEITWRDEPRVQAVNMDTYLGPGGTLDTLDPKPVVLTVDPNTRKVNWDEGGDAPRVIVPSRGVVQDLASIYEKVDIRGVHVIVTRKERPVLVLLPLEWKASAASAEGGGDQPS
jgi:hypothetical protein